MLDSHRDTAMLSAGGVLAVVLTGLAVDFLAPETGKLIRFFAPLLVGTVFAAKIYLNELEKVEKKLEEQD